VNGTSNLTSNLEIHHTAIVDLPANVTVMRAGLSCEPCWTSSPPASCAGRISCLAALSVDEVEEEIRGSLNADVDMIEAIQACGLLSVPACEPQPVAARTAATCAPRRRCSCNDNSSCDLRPLWDTVEDRLFKIRLPHSFRVGRRSRDDHPGPKQRESRCRRR
jgi:hypothetical protein